MSRKIYITEAQLRNLMRSKINENIATDETNIEDVYRAIIHLVNNSELTVENYEWVDDETLEILYSFNMDSDNTFNLEVVVYADVNYSYEYEKGSYYDAYGDPGTPDFFDDNFDFKFEIHPNDITIIREDDDERIEIDNNTYEAIIKKVYDNATHFYKENFDYDGYREDYCYDDEPEPCYRDDY